MKTYSLSLKSSTDNINKLLNESENFLKSSIPAEKCYDILICLDEAFANISQHAYCSKNSCSIDVKIYLKENKEISIVFRDYSQKTPNVEKSGPGEDMIERDSPGVGVYIMKKLMDKVRYRRIWNSNFLLMTKKF